MKFLALILFCLLFVPFVQGEPVCKVIDGDTFVFCDGMTVRLSGIDAPEKGELFYWDARRMLAGLVQTHSLELKNCHIDDTGKRQACDVYADGKDIQSVILRAGLAWEWPVYSMGRYRDIELEAMLAKRGVHSDKALFDKHWQGRDRDRRLILKEDGPLNKSHRD